MNCELNFNGIYGKFTLEKYRGKKIVLYFYPKDNTKGCTLEAVEFSELINEFEKLNTVVIGVSKDSLSSHRKFIDKNSLGINLVSDEDLSIQKYFEVWKLKKLYGKEYMGTVRSTFIIDENGKVIKEFRNVKAKGHAKTVLEELRNLE